jgi:superfamily II DNA or RNA helicase
MRSVPVVVDSHLRLDGNLIGHDLANDIFDDLEIPNEEKVWAERQQRWGWEDLPDNFQLGWLDGDTVVMPRGYALRLKRKLRAQNLRVQWVDRRRRGRGPALSWRQEFTPREHQPATVRSLTKHQQGIYEAPTGSGKTLACLMFIQRVRPARILIMVEKLDLLNQWKMEIDKWFGSNYVGTIGSGKWDDSKRITVATAQTLWRAYGRPELSEDPNVVAWFDSFDCVIVDECHHCSARTIEFLAGNFTAKYRFGVSATPDKQDDKYEITRAVLGDIIHRDDERKLRKAGVLVRPTVSVIDTDFKFVYWGDHDSDRHGNCEVPGCKRRDQHHHVNNYQKLKDKLVHDPARNKAVMASIMEQVRDGAHHHLVISDEIRQLEALNDMMSTRYMESRTPAVFILTGQVNGKRRAELVEQIKREPEAIIFATVAKEGLDIPQIDRIYLPFPASNAKATQQKIGRGTRTHDGKQAALIIDYRDRQVPVLRRQFRNRKVKCYDKLDIDVVFANSR